VTPGRASDVAPERTAEPTANATDRSVAGGIAWALFGIAVFLFVFSAAHNMRPGGDLTDRVANPAVTGAPRPVEPLFGDTNWMTKMQVGTLVMMSLVVILFVVMWRRHPRHPVLLMAVACTAIVWMDPIMNWAPYAVYNPQLWHWPESWPLVSLSPTVEPLVVFGYVTFYLLPYFPAMATLRRLQQRRPATSFVWRHPLISMAMLILAIGFVFDAALEIFSIRAGLYIYSQVIPWGSVFVGEAYQFPLIWESMLVTLVMIPAGVLLYRDDTGRTQAEKLARRLHGRVFRGRPALATFSVMFAILMVAYSLYGLGFAVIRWSGQATSVACPYPYPEAKVYDPQGYYAEAGQPGPYFVGIWSSWQPRDSSARSNERCGPG
jgi:Spirocyclase AveC-like